MVKVHRWRSIRKGQHFDSVMAPPILKELGKVEESVFPRGARRSDGREMPLSMNSVTKKTKMLVGGYAEIPSLWFFETPHIDAADFAVEGPYWPVSQIASKIYDMQLWGTLGRAVEERARPRETTPALQAVLGLYCFVFVTLFSRAASSSARAVLFSCCCVAFSSGDPSAAGA